MSRKHKKTPQRKIPNGVLGKVNIGKPSPNILDFNKILENFNVSKNKTSESINVEMQYICAPLLEIKGAIKDFKENYKGTQSWYGHLSIAIAIFTSFLGFDYSKITFDVSPKQTISKTIAFAIFVICGVLFVCSLSKMVKNRKKLSVEYFIIQISNQGNNLASIKQIVTIGNNK